MRFLKGDVLIYYPNVRFALLNLHSYYFEANKSADVEDVDLNKFYSLQVPCNCLACRLMQQSNEETEKNDENQDGGGNEDVGGNEDGGEIDRQGEHNEEGTIENNNEPSVNQTRSGAESQVTD